MVVVWRAAEGVAIFLALGFAVRLVHRLREHATVCVAGRIVRLIFITLNRGLITRGCDKLRSFITT